MKTRKLLAVLLVFALLFAGSSYGLKTEGDLAGKKLEITARDGRSYVAAEDLEDFGFKYETKENKIILKSEGGKVTITFATDYNEMWVGKSRYTIDARAFVNDKKAFVPLRLFFDTIGYKVGYNAETKSVIINKRAATKFPITIKDEANKLSYSFKKPVTSIVSLAPSVTEILYAIGAGDLVKARTNYCNYPAAAEKLPSVGTLYTPDLEKIVDLSPDIAIAATHMNEDVLKSLDGAGILTLTNASPNDFEGIYYFIDALGKLTDREYNARALISSMRSKHDRINDLVAKMGEYKKPQVYYAVGTGKSEFTAGGDTFVNSIITAAGAENAASDVKGWSYSLEKLIDKNPEYIVGGEYAIKTMRTGENYQALTAIKDSKYMVVDSAVFARPGPRVLDYSVKSLLNRLFPNAVKSLGF